MFHRLHRFRRLLATTFLAVFVNVLVGQCWCTTGQPGPAAGQPTAAGAAKSCCPAMAAAAAPAPKSCCGHGRATAPAAGQVATAPHRGGQPAPHSSGNHNCCRNKSASLLAALAAPAGQHLLPLAPALLPEVAAFYFPPRAATAEWGHPAAVRRMPPRHLPPKIPDIRIFIQSLTV